MIFLNTIDAPDAILKHTSLDFDSPRTVHAFLWPHNSTIEWSYQNSSAALMRIQLHPQSSPDCSEQYRPEE